MGELANKSVPNMLSSFAEGYTEIMTKKEPTGKMYA